MLSVMEPKTLTDDAVISIQALMLEVAGLSGAEAEGLSDSPAGARAEGGSGAGVCLGGWRGGTRDMPAAHLGLTWGEHVAEVWDGPGAHASPDLVVSTGVDRQESDDDQSCDEQKGEKGHHSPARRLLATLEAAFTN